MVMCEFCKPGDYGFSPLEGEHNGTFYFDKGKVSYNYQGYSAEIYDEAKINYCPMCGRKLEEENC